MLHQMNDHELSAVKVGLCLLANAIDDDALSGMQERLLTNSGMYRTPRSNDVFTLITHLEIHKIPECVSQLMATVESLLNTCELSLDDIEPETEVAIDNAKMLLQSIKREVN